jgi:chromosome segregation ATPase
MGWVSCLEDSQERLDDAVNTIQGLLNGIDPRMLYKVNQLREELHNLQGKLDGILEVVTDPEIGSKIDLVELREAYEQKEQHNQQLQRKLVELRKQCEDQSRRSEELETQLTALNGRLKAEVDIAENATAKFYKEQKRREKAEAKLQNLQKLEKGR